MRGRRRGRGCRERTESARGKGVRMRWPFAQCDEKGGIELCCSFAWEAQSVGSLCIRCRVLLSWVRDEIHDVSVLTCTGVGVQVGCEMIVGGICLVTTNTTHLQRIHSTGWLGKVT